MVESPVDQIIKKFGGQNALGRAISVRQSSVARWKKIGFIPTRQQTKILIAARSQGIDVKPSDFFVLNEVGEVI